MSTRSAISLPPSYDESDDVRSGSTVPGFVSEQASDDAISASMIGWGIGLAVGITALVLLIGPSSGDKNKDNNHTHTHSHS